VRRIEKIFLLGRQLGLQVSNCVVCTLGTLTPVPELLGNSVDFFSLAHRTTNRCLLEV
jgi:hypothetical protein